VTLDGALKIYIRNGFKIYKYLFLVKHFVALMNIWLLKLFKSYLMIIPLIFGQSEFYYLN